MKFGDNAYDSVDEERRGEESDEMDNQQRKEVELQKLKYRHIEERVEGVNVPACG